jgi:hypothetical protein
VPTREGAQLPIERAGLPLERLDHRDEHRDLLTRGRRQHLSGEPFAPV